MERIIQSYCEYDHLALSLCSDDYCQYSALNCQLENCKACQRHVNCQGKILLVDLLQKLQIKGESSAHNEDIVLQFYDNIIKALERDKLEYQKSKSESGFQLFGRQEKLYNLLKQGPSKKISSKLVLEVEQSLKYEPSNKGNKNIKLFKQLNNHKTQIINILEKLKELWRPKIDYFFSQYFCCKNTYFIDNEKSIQRIIDDRKSYIALIEPMITNKSKICLKIVTDCRLYLGVYIKSIVKDSNYMNCFNLGEGAYQMHYNGYFLSHNNEKQNRINTNFKFKQREIVQITCDLENQKIIFSNNQQCPNVTMNIKVNPDQELYFGIQTWFCYQNVQIV